MSTGSCKSNYIYALLLIALIFYAVPSLVLANNADSLSHFSAPFTLGALAALTLVGGFIMCIFVFVVHSLSIEIALLPLRFLFFFFLLTGLFLPLTAAGGMIEIHLLELDRGHLMLALIIATLMFAVSFTRLRGALMFGVLTTVLVTATTASISAYEKMRVRDSSALEIASSGTNLFVLSFDGLPGPVSSEILKANADLRGAFEGFTIFENVASSAPATLSSIMAEISGIPDLKARFDTLAAASSALAGTPQLITNRLDRAGFTVSTYSSYNLGFGKKSRQFGKATLVEKVSVRSGITQVGEILTYAAVRMTSSAFVTGTNPAAWIVDRIESFEGGRVGTLLGQLEQHAGKALDAANILDILDFELYVQNLHVETDVPVAHFLHFVHTHFPVDFDRDCEYRSNDKDWFKNNQNIEGLRGQTECALDQFRHFLNKLKAMGVYEKSLIILKSDHGEPVEYNDPAGLESFAIRNHKYWGLGRYVPFLAVKLPGSGIVAPKFDQRPVALSDLALSICHAILREDGSCEDYQGYDIFNSEAPIPKDAVYMLEIVRSASSSFRMDDHEMVEIPRAGGVLYGLNELLISEILSVTPECHTEINIDKGQQYGNGLTDQKRWVTWSDGPVSYVTVLWPSCGVKRIQIRLEDDTDVEEIAINGEPAEFTSVDETGSLLAVQVPKDLIIDNHLTVALDTGGGGGVPMSRISFFD